MTGTTEDGIVIDRDFTATPAAVFAAWTTPAHFARWFGGSDVEVPPSTLEFNARPGNTWKAQMKLPNGRSIDWTGDFIEVVTNERVVFTITDQPNNPERAQIVVELTAIDGGTHMRFTQETPGFTPDEQSAVLAGWEGFLNELESIATS